MEAFEQHAGTCLPLRRSSVDTDQIVPSRFLKRVSRHGFEDALFASWREDPRFVLNSPEYAEASILVAGPDFGTGSSREHAVWALMDYGFRVVISPRFADIFRGNCGKRGLVAAQVEDIDQECLMSAVEADSTLRVSVDLPAQQIRFAGTIVPFQIDEHVKHRLLQGLDDIDLTERSEDRISAYEQSRSNYLPRIHRPA